MAHKHNKTCGHRSRGRWTVMSPGKQGISPGPKRHSRKSRKKYRNRKKRLHIIEKQPPIVPGPPVKHDGALTYTDRRLAALRWRGLE